MFIRDPWTTDLWQQAGPVLINALSGEPVATDQVLLRQLHGLALSIYQAQQDVLAAQARNDPAYVQARLLDVRRLRDLFAVKSAQFHSNDAALLGTIDRFVLAVGSWVETALAHLPAAIAAIPIAILDGVTQIGVKAGVSALAVSVPLLLLGGLALVFVMQAEKSRTVRRLVR